MQVLSFKTGWAAGAWVSLGVAMGGVPMLLAADVVATLLAFIAGLFDPTWVRPAHQWALAAAGLALVPYGIGEGLRVVVKQHSPD